MSSFIECYEQEFAIDSDLNVIPLDQKMLQIPQLHAKWLGHYMRSLDTLEKLQAIHEQQNAEAYNKYRYKWENKLNHNEAMKFVNGDTDVLKAKYNLNMHKHLTSYLERSTDIIKGLSFIIQHSQEWQMFIAGGGK